MKRLVIATLAAVVLAVACSTVDAAPQGRGRGHLKHAAKATRGQATAYREFVLPVGTALPLALASPVSSDQSKVEDRVLATVREPVIVDRQVVLARGTQVIGYVTGVDQSGRVKGRARLAMRFSSLTQDGDEYTFRSEPIEVVADATKGEDAKKIGIGAGAGAAIGAILDGAAGAATGAAIGGAAGTGAVLATRGDEVRLGSGQALDTHLTAALPVRVRTP